MAFLNRCIWTATSAGVVDFAVSAAAQGGYTPTDCLNPAVVDGATYHYFAVSGAQREEGDGVYTSSTHTIARTTIRNSTNGGSKVNFTSPPVVTMGGPVATDVLIPAVGSLTWNVATTGSDSNPGTASSPFRTIQKAINAANSYNWGNLYFPTINLSNGATYNEQVSLVALSNCPAGGVITGNIGSPSSVTVSDLGTDYAFKAQPYSIWTVNGIKTAGTYGGYDGKAYSYLTITAFELGGTLTQQGLLVENLATMLIWNTTLRVTATAMGYLAYSRGTLVADNCAITFANAITFSMGLIGLDATISFFAFAGGTFTNGSNVSIAGAARPLVMTNGAFFEASSTTKVDGVLLYRGNIPGTTHGQLIDTTSVFEGDLAYRVDFPASGATVSMQQGQKEELVVPGGTIAALTIVLPPFPNDGERVRIASATQIVTLTIASSDGSSIIAPSFLAAFGGFELIYIVVSNLWAPSICTGSTSNLIGATTVAALPSAATVGAGARNFVTDATVTLAAGLGNIVVGGGANSDPVYSDATNWRIG